MKGSLIKVKAGYSHPDVSPYGVVLEMALVNRKQKEKKAAVTAEKRAARRRAV